MSPQAAAAPLPGPAASRPVDGSFATNPVLRHHWFAVARTSGWGAPRSRETMSDDRGGTRHGVRHARVLPSLFAASDSACVRVAAALNKH